MNDAQENVLSTLKPALVKARAKILAHEDRELKAELIRIRIESGLTQKDLAGIMGVTQQAIHKLERYDSDPKASTLRRYANALGALRTSSAEGPGTITVVGDTRWMGDG